MNPLISSQAPYHLSRLGPGWPARNPHVDQRRQPVHRQEPDRHAGDGQRSRCCDVSPRGGRPGSSTVLDDTRVAIPDLNGNNRLDSLQNVVDNPQAGLLFLIPGLDDVAHQRPGHDHYGR